MMKIAKNIYIYIYIRGRRKGLTLPLSILSERRASKLSEVNAS